MANLHGGSPEISFLGTGDCGPTHGPKDGFPIERYTELVRPTLAEVDLRFGNCERQYSARKKEGAGLTGHGCQPPEMAQIFTDCGYDAMTIANNHMYDFGPAQLLDTRALLLEKGIQVTGAGKDLDEARQPAIVECKGIKVGFLGYWSVIPHGGEAGPKPFAAYVAVFEGDGMRGGAGAGSGELMTLTHRRDAETTVFAYELRAGVEYAVAPAFEVEDGKEPRASTFTLSVVADSPFKMSLLRAGRAEEARALFDATLVRARELQVLPVQVRCLTGQGLAARAAGDPEAARVAFRAGIPAA